MSERPPLVVAILHSDEEEVGDQLYCEAYGIEMQVDNEWNAEAVLLAPHDHLEAVTENTDVTGEDAAIVSAGVTDIPVSGDGSPDVSMIRDEKNNWLLVGDQRLSETDEMVTRKLQAALAADCRVIICIAGTSSEHIAARTAGLASIDCSRIVFALAYSDAPSDTATATAHSILDQLASIGASGQPRFVVAGDITAENARDMVALAKVDGVFLMDDRYDDFGTILEVLEALGD